MLRALVLLAGMIAGAAQAAPLAGISYTPSGMTTFADIMRDADEARIKADIAQLKGLTNEIRIYTSVRKLDRIIPLAAAAGMKVTLGIYQGKDEAVNKAEIAQGIAAFKANAETITRIVVGNESVQNGFRTAEQVVQAMAEVRRGIGGKVPVGTAEIWSIWMGAPALAAGSDFIGAHLLPYWDSVPVDGAVPYVRGRIADLHGKYPNKPLLVAETGWPASGPPRGGAVPSPENQARYVRAFAADARTHPEAYFIAEAYDQPWKAAAEGDLPLWGLFDVARQPKAAVRDLQAKP